MGAGIAVFILLFGFAGFGLKKNHELAEEAAIHAKNTVDPYLQLIQNQELEKAYEKFTHSDYKKELSKENFTNQQKSNYNDFGKLNSYEFFQSKNGNGFLEVNEFYLYYSLTFERLATNAVFLVRRSETDPNIFHIVKTYKSEYKRLTHFIY